MRSSTVSSVVGSLSLILFVACGEATPSGNTPDGGTNANTDAGTSPTADAGGDTTFDCTGVSPASLEDVFNTHFASSSPTGCVAGCHGVGAGLLTFSTPAELWAATVNVRARGSKLDLVEPGDPGSSFLYEKLLPTASSRMPQGGPYLDDGALAEVAGWICAGAPAPYEPDGGMEIPLTITGFDPTSGSVGTRVAITGTGFANVPGDNVVHIGGVTAPVVAASTTEIEIDIPAGATTGRISIQTHGQSVESDSSFVVIAGNPVPSIGTLSPCGVVAGAGATTVTVTGSNFLPETTATFGGQPVTVTWNSANEIELAVAADMLATAPAGRSALIVLSNPSPGGGASAPVEFGIAGQVATLSAHVQPIFTSSCATAGCHNGGAGTDLDLRQGQAWADLVSVPSSGCAGKIRVTACAPSRSGSVLVDKILATAQSPACSGSPMPKGQPLSAAEKQKIIDWVAQGAPQ